ncbi:MAG: hypothetical protein ACOCWG_00175 [bacterium]
MKYKYKEDELKVIIVDGDYIINDLHNNEVNEVYTNIKLKKINNKRIDKLSVTTSRNNRLIIRNSKGIVVDSIFTDEEIKSNNDNNLKVKIQRNDKMIIVDNNNEVVEDFVHTKKQIETINKKFKILNKKMKFEDRLHFFNHFGIRENHYNFSIKLKLDEKRIDEDFYKYIKNGHISYDEFSIDDIFSIDRAKIVFKRSVNSLLIKIYGLHRLNIKLFNELLNAYIEFNKPLSMTRKEKLEKLFQKN